MARIPTPAPAFTPPPPERHITEGSFFVGDDRVIRQVTDGQAEPVTYCGVLAPQPTAPRTARRIAALIGIARPARAASCNRRTKAGPRPAPARTPASSSTAPTTAFVARYGPINKTTFGETKDGSVIRRMPNLVKFREDPDAMLVMALEEYDEVTGEAKKAADHAEGRGRPHAAGHARRAPPRKGCSSRSTARDGRPALHRRRSTASPKTQSSRNWAT